MAGRGRGREGAGGRGGGRLRPGQRPVTESTRLSITEQLELFQRSDATGECRGDPADALVIAIGLPLRLAAPPPPLLPASAACERRLRAPPAACPLHCCCRVCLPSGAVQPRPRRGARRVQEVWLPVQVARVRCMLRRRRPGAGARPAAGADNLLRVPLGSVRTPEALHPDPFISVSLPLSSKGDGRCVTVYKRRARAGADPRFELPLGPASLQALDAYFRVRARPVGWLAGSAGLRVIRAIPAKPIRR